MIIAYRHYPFYRLIYTKYRKYAFDGNRANPDSKGQS